MKDTLAAGDANASGRTEIGDRQPYIYPVMTQYCLKDQKAAGQVGEDYSSFHREMGAEARKDGIRRGVSLTVAVAASTRQNAA